MASNTLLSLLLFVGWTIGLVILLAAYRSYFVFFKKRKINDFKPTGEDVSPFSQRICRAHMNCVENLPIFIAIVFLSYVTNSLVLTDELAFVFIGFRLLQSITHLVSTNPFMVSVRFAFFIAQISILFYWGLHILPKIL